MQHGTGLAWHQHCSAIRATRAAAAQIVPFSWSASRQIYLAPSSTGKYSRGSLLRAVTTALSLSLSPSHCVITNLIKAILKRSTARAAVPSNFGVCQTRPQKSACSVQSSHTTSPFQISTEMKSLSCISLFPLIPQAPVNTQTIQCSNEQRKRRNVPDAQNNSAFPDAKTCRRETEYHSVISPVGSSKIT